MSDVSTVRDFRRATSHAPGRPAPGGPFDPAIEPDKVKRYRGGRTIELPAGWDDAEAPMGDVLSGVRAEDVRPVDLTELARLLFLTHGVTRIRRRGQRVRHFRAAPSAGALYPIEVYVVSGGLRDLAAGVHHHDPVARTLREIRRGDERNRLARAAADAEVATAPISLVFTGVPWRTTWKYGPRGYRHLFWDAGALIANTLVAAASAGWRTRLLSGFVDRTLADLTALESQPFQELALAVVSLGPKVGHVGRELPDEPDQPLAKPDLSAEPLSAEERTYGEIAEVHAAGDLDTSEQVSSWRADRSPDDLPLPLEPPATPAAAGGTVDEVILQRGSTRRFDPDATLPADLLRWALSAAAAPVAGDLAPPDRTPVIPIVAAHALEGVENGLYRSAPGGLRRLGDQRRQDTAHQCLDQALGGTSVATTMWCCDLEGILSSDGPRGYRSAELAAGIAGERLQLASFTLGQGGTGLTFYDEEIEQATGLDPLLVTAVGAPDYEPTSGQRPRSGSR